MKKFKEFYRKVTNPETPADWLAVAESLPSPVYPYIKGVSAHDVFKQLYDYAELHGRVVDRGPAPAAHQVTLVINDVEYALTHVKRSDYVALYTSRRG